MKLLKADEMKEIDRRATSDYMIPSVVLMENAGLRVLEATRDLIGNLTDIKVVILAGPGNNGGDGLVLARHLINAGAKVDIYLLGETAQLSQDAALNYGILVRMAANLYPLRTDADLKHWLHSMLSADLLVDAIYGIGFRGALDEFKTQVVKIVNQSNVPVLAVDIPSGVEADTGKVHGVAVRADLTVTFALPKIGLYLEHGPNYVGKLHIADISIPHQLLDDPKIRLNLIDSAILGKYIKPRQSESHKGTYGHVLAIGGSPGMTGAMAMTSLAALRSGAGLVTAALPESLVPILESLVMEVMSMPLQETGGHCISLEALPVLENLMGTATVCAIGPGMSRYREANAIIRFILEHSGLPVLIDADGLNALEGDTDILRDRQVPVIITPHPGEMSRLTGLTVEEIQHNRIEVARSFAAKWGITVVLKGNKTLVATASGEVFMNCTGNPGMATGGSGDVLSGIIAGFIAQGMRPQNAAVAGVYVHGLCGDAAAENLGQRGLAAGDLIDHLPYILREFEIC